MAHERRLTAYALLLRWLQRIDIAPDDAEAMLEALSDVITDEGYDLIVVETGRNYEIQMVKVYQSDQKKKG